MELHGEKELELPLTKEAELVKVDQILDLTNNDLVGCNVINTKDGSKVKRFMVIDSTQIILVEPEASRLGFGVVKLAGLLQDIEVTGDQNDSRALNITIHKSCSTKIGSMATHSKSTLSPPKRPPLLSAKFIFDDHIRLVWRLLPSCRRVIAVIRILLSRANETGNKQRQIGLEGGEGEVGGRGEDSKDEADEGDEGVNSCG